MLLLYTVYAFDSDQVLLINEPSVCMGALWIPYRRDSNLMKAILKSSAQRSDISMVFCHADVKGAYMNDGMKCREGIDISHFPDKLPIYSGHFHKPHTVSCSLTNDIVLHYIMLKRQWILLKFVSAHLNVTR